MSKLSLSVKPLEPRGPAPDEVRVREEEEIAELVTVVLADVEPGKSEDLEAPAPETMVELGSVSPKPWPLIEDALYTKPTVMTTRVAEAKIIFSTGPPIP